MDPEEIERRGQGRVQVQAEIEVDTAARRLHAVLRELSRESARLTMAEMPGDLLELHLPGPRGIVDVLTEVLRVTGEAPHYNVVVQLSVVDPTQQRALEELLQLLLAGPGGGKREAPRIAKRMEIQFGDHQRALLVDLSRGGLGMIVGGPFQTGQVVTVTLAGLRLRCKVVNQRVVPRAGRNLFHAGLQFEGLDAQTRARLDELLGQLV